MARTSCWLGRWSSRQTAGEVGEGWLSRSVATLTVECTTGTPNGFDGLDRRDGVLDQERVIHRADGGQLGGLVADEQECRVLGREEMVGQRVAHRGGAM